ncbi:phosphopentomutase [Methylocapsa sp. S129]|uniref:phosphopentomutase n=1 Tax=Methylocapsa sp. S129 TaxID=1641869 RepID=UPI00131C5C77|nr:phosphopentomutase [Methylocapsa sp. S129]
MGRAIIIVLDSVGCGAAEDAGVYGDAGADTLGHIAQACAEGCGDRVGLREGSLRLPNLDRLGLGRAMQASTGHSSPGLGLGEPAGQWGYGVETSLGKDTPSGHWEIAGTPVQFKWGYFSQTMPAFPPEFTRALIAEGELPGILGDKHASGTAIIEEFGEEHLGDLKPICYTSADSVLQIAAHEHAFGLERLYALCKIARRLCDPLNIGRVIARPFVGRTSADFVRTAHRKDFAMPPPAGNLLERAALAGHEIICVGKIGDIFAHRHTGRELKGANNNDHVDLTLRALAEARDGALIFVNLVDFDTDFGHRRDVPGYAACLESFDARLPELTAAMRDEDFCIVTADHGNDPTWRGYDHTREHVPILSFGKGVAPGPIGRRETLADIAETIAQRLGLAAGAHGRSWLA